MTTTMLGAGMMILALWCVTTATKVKSTGPAVTRVDQLTRASPQGGPGSRNLVNARGTVPSMMSVRKRETRF
eukprot:1072610-Amphidinium_carterae.1